MHLTLRSGLGVYLALFSSKFWKILEQFLSNPINQCNLTNEYGNDNKKMIYSVVSKTIHLTLRIFSTKF